MALPLPSSLRNAPPRATYCHRPSHFEANTEATRPSVASAVTSTASPSTTTSSPWSHRLQPVVSTTRGFARRLANFCSPSPVENQMAPSAHTATTGVTWGRPSVRTVEIQNSSASSRTFRVSSHPVTAAPELLYSRLSLVTGAVIAIAPLAGEIVRVILKYDRRAVTPAGGKTCACVQVWCGTSLARVDRQRAEAVLVEPLHEQHRPGRRVRVADQLLEPLRAGLDRRRRPGLPDRLRGRRPVISLPQGQAVGTGDRPANVPIRSKRMIRGRHRQRRYQHGRADVDPLARPVGQLVGTVGPQHAVRVVEVIGAAVRRIPHVVPRPRLGRRIELDPADPVAERRVRPGDGACPKHVVIRVPADAAEPRHAGHLQLTDHAPRLADFEDRSVAPAADQQL